MKTFEDLMFGPHPRAQGSRARLMLDNGLSVSVIIEDGTPSKYGFNIDYETNEENPYELALLDEYGMVKEDSTYPQGYVWGYLNEVTLMAKINEIAGWYNGKV
jgi:hypothetical protein